MTGTKSSLETLDRPEVLERLFFPRRASAEELTSPYGINHIIEAAPAISIGCRFYPAGSMSPNILYFHGNGEIAPDYDYTAPPYQERGINLFVADYRGYGLSTGSPTSSAIIEDAHPVFDGFVSFLEDGGYTGDLFVMGRSLGSAPAIEVAFHYQDRLKGLIVESGFASTGTLLERLGASHLLEGRPGRGRLRKRPEDRKGHHPHPHHPWRRGRDHPRRRGTSPLLLVRRLTETIPLYSLCRTQRPYGSRHERIHACHCRLYSIFGRVTTGPMKGGSVNTPFYQIDAFTSRVFSGNPAGVCLLDEWPDDAAMQSIAAENNLSETAFLVK